MKKYKRFYLTALSQRLCNLANKIRAQTIRFLTVTSWQNRFFPALSISAFLFAIKLASILCSFVLHRFGSLDNLPYEIVANLIDFLLWPRLPCNLAVNAYFLQVLLSFRQFHTLPLLWLSALLCFRQYQVRRCCFQAHFQGSCFRRQSVQYRPVCFLRFPAIEVFQPHFLFPIH